MSLRAGSRVFAPYDTYTDVVALTTYVTPDLGIDERPRDRLGRDVGVRVGQIAKLGVPRLQVAEPRGGAPAVYASLVNPLTSPLCPVLKYNGCVEIRMLEREMVARVRVRVDADVEAQAACAARSSRSSRRTRRSRG